MRDKSAFSIKRRTATQRSAHGSHARWRAYIYIYIYIHIYIYTSRGREVRTAHRKLYYAVCMQIRLSPAPQNAIVPRPGVQWNRMTRSAHVDALNARARHNCNRAARSQEVPSCVRVACAKLRAASCVIIFPATSLAPGCGGHRGDLRVYSFFPSPGDNNRVPHLLLLPPPYQKPILSRIYFLR